jgi:hypothetical protein
MEFKNLSIEEFSKINNIDEMKKFYNSIPKST